MGNTSRRPALQAALQMLPEDKWGTVVVHYKELYPNIQNYTDQLRAAEKLRDANPELPALHLLLGYHFGYLGYPKEAVKELEEDARTVAQGRDRAKALRHVFGQAGRTAQAGGIDCRTRRKKPSPREATS